MVLWDVVSHENNPCPLFGSYTNFLPQHFKYINRISIFIIKPSLSSVPVPDCESNNKKKKNIINTF